MHAALKQFLRKRRKQREGEFDERYTGFLEGWRELEQSAALIVLKDVRNKVAAHSELNYVSGSYRPATLGSLGLKSSHFAEAISAMRPVVERVQNLVRPAGFSWTALDKQLGRMGAAHWSTL